jgi:hypothetical protein
MAVAKVVAMVGQVLRVPLPVPLFSTEVEVAVASTVTPKATRVEVQAWEVSAVVVPQRRSKGPAVDSMALTDLAEVVAVIHSTLDQAPVVTVSSLFGTSRTGCP